MGSSVAPDSSAWITFLSDYGLDDHFVGVCKGVLANRAPQAKIIDICHQVAPQNVGVGARLLADAVPYLPVGVHLALVDPFRRGHARPIGVRCHNGSVIVCPDNGLSSLAWEPLGGIESARELTNSALWGVRDPAKSFRGRDLFAPVAGALVSGTPWEQVGDEIEPATITVLEPVTPYVHVDHVHGTIRMVDHFGNLQLNVARSDLEAAGIALGDEMELRIAGKTFVVPYTLSFTEMAPGRTFVYEDSFRAIAVVTNMGRAAEVLRARDGDPIVLSRRQAAAGSSEHKVRVVDSPPSTATA